jgi:hypothetical protein
MLGEMPGVSKNYVSSNVNDRRKKSLGGRRSGTRKEKSESRRKSKKERKKRKKKKFKSVYQIAEEILVERVNEYHANNDNREIFAKRIITQDGVWYLALPALEINRIEATETVRKYIKKYIKPICKSHGVEREDIGIIAGARATMYYRGEFKAVSFFEVSKLAMNATDVVYIEKMGMVEAFKDFADEKRIALVNSQGQFTDYAKDLSTLALESGGHVFVMTDLDLAGIIMASKLGPNVPWIGINMDWIEHFNIPLPSLPDPYGSSVKKYPEGEQRHVVVPLDLKSKPKDKDKLRKLVEDGINEIEDEETDGEKITVKDTRFMGKVDLDWLWTKDVEYTKKNGKRGRRVEGHKIEIDAVLKDQGSEKVWQYMLEQMEKYRPKRDYTRVIPSYIYTTTPQPPMFSSSIHVHSTDIKIALKLQSYVKDRAHEITEQPKEEKKQELEDYPGFIDDVDAKEREIEQEVEDIVHDDEIMNDIRDLVDNAIKEGESELSVQSALDEAAAKVGKTIIKGLKKLEAEKGYEIVAALGLEEDDEEGSQNSKDDNTPPP